ncbi:MAG: hypothetical protein NC452_15380 [Eubacterium sp.]|nr:hypothetical protein [Eubacterium sp.]
MKRLILTCFVCFVLCGCSNQMYDINDKTTFSENTALNEEKKEDFTNFTTTENHNINQSKFDSENAISNKWEPNVFDLGKRTIENFSPPWTEELVEKAWQMSYLSDNFTSYMDRCFADIDNDGTTELILTSNNVFFCMAAYKINDEEIQYLGTINFGGDIGRSILTMPPTEPEILDPCNDKSDLWNYNAEHTEKRNFKISQDEKGNCYFTGYGVFDADNQCYVINIGIEDNRIIWKKAYQWGYRWAYDINTDSGRWFLYYSSYDQSGEEQSVNKQYIDDFLMQLK